MEKGKRCWRGRKLPVPDLLPNNSSGTDKLTYSPFVTSNSKKGNLSSAACCHYSMDTTSSVLLGMLVGVGSKSRIVASEAESHEKAWAV